MLNVFLEPRDTARRRGVKSRRAWGAPEGGAPTTTAPTTASSNTHTAGHPPPRSARGDGHGFAKLASLELLEAVVLVLEKLSSRPATHTMFHSVGLLDVLQDLVDAASTDPPLSPRATDASRSRVAGGGGGGGGGGGDVAQLVASVGVGRPGHTPRAIRRRSRRHPMPDHGNRSADEGDASRGVSALPSFEPTLSPTGKRLKASPLAHVLATDGVELTPGDRTLLDMIDDADGAGGAGGADGGRGGAHTSDDDAGGSDDDDSVLVGDGGLLGTPSPPPTSPTRHPVPQQQWQPEATAGQGSEDGSDETDDARTFILLNMHSVIANLVSGAAYVAPMP